MSLRIKKLLCAVMTSVLLCCAAGFALTAFRASADSAGENFYMENGAFVRYNDDTPGIRFTSYITEEYYNQLKAKSQNGEVSFYTVLEKTGSTAEKVKIPHNRAITFDENDKAVFNAALIFRLEDRELTEAEVIIASAIEMKAESFAEYTDTNGQNVVVTATGSGVIRSMRGIANYAVRVGVTAEERVFLDKYLGNVTTDTEVKEVEVADKSAVEMFGLTSGAVYSGARKVGDIKSGKIDFSAETINLGTNTEFYVFDGQNNCTLYTCRFVEKVTLAEEYVKGLNRAAVDYTFALNGEDAVIGVTAGETELTSADYSQSGNIVTIKGSVFNTAADVGVVIRTASAKYEGTVEVYDMAIGTLDEFKVFWSRTTFASGSTVTGRFVFTADIDASSYSFHGGTVIANVTFNGVLDGKGYTVKGIHSSYYGLLQNLEEQGVIKNIAFTGIRFYRTSAIFNDNIKGTLENCYFEGTGGTAADNNALTKYMANTAVFKNVVVYLHDRPSGTESQTGMFRSSMTMPVAPSGLYVINTSSNGSICTDAGATDISDIHLYSSLEEFKADVTSLPSGFSAEMWHMSENGLSFGKKIQNYQLTEEYVKGLNREAEDYTFTLNSEDKVKSVVVGGVNLTASDYTQNGDTVTIKSSAFETAGDISVVINTSVSVYSGTVEVYDMAIGTLDEFKTFWSVKNMTGTVTQRVVLTADIDATGYDNGGNIGTPEFAGVLDGKGHTIKNARAGWNGLFYNLGETGVVRNVAFTGIRFVAVPTIFGYMLKGAVENCYFETSVNSEKLGTNNEGINPAFTVKMFSTAVIKNVVVNFTNRSEKCATKNGVFGSVDNNAVLTTAPKGVYVINDSCNGNICDNGAATDISDIHLYSSLAEFKAEVTELPEGFSADMWRIDGNGGLIFISSPSIVLAGTLHDINVKENSARTFVKNSKSDYTILYDNEGENLKKAVKFITDNVYKATGVTLKTEVYSSGRENSWTSASKLIVFNNEELFAKAGLVMPKADLGSGGYYIKTIGNTVFIMCSGEYGYQLGAIRFLNETLGFDRLSEDCTVYEKNGETIPDMEISEKPDYEYRMPSTFKMPNAVYGMGFNMTTFASMFMSVPDRATGTNAAFYHNSFNYLPPSMYASAHPKWYSNVNNASKQQLCYTAQGDTTEYLTMVSTLYEYLKQIVDANPNLCNITVTHQDNQSYCECTECKKVVSTYGAISAAYIMFLNDIDDLLQADLGKEALANGTTKREVNIVFFAYHGTKESPTKLVNGKYQPTSDKVVMNEHVGVIVAPIESYYTSTFYGTKNITDGESENIKSWSCLTNKVYVWLYETYFNNYFYPYNSWDTILTNYMFCYENSAIYMFDQGQHNQASPTAFMAFKYYLDSKAGINVNYNYAELENKFFNGYFKEASAPMKKYFYSLKARLEYLEKTYAAVDGGINNGKSNVLADANYWTVAVLNEYAGYISEALVAISAYETTDPATYTMLKNHILAESLFPEYALLTLHADKLSATELAARRKAFKNNCETLGLTQEAETTSKSLSALFESWGLN